MGGAHAPTTLLAATLSDPEAREALHRQLLSATRTRLNPLIKGLKLNQEAAEKLLGLGADWGLKNVSRDRRRVYGGDPDL